MLIIIGLLIVYIDIAVGGVDVIPDVIGYLLMVPGFFIERSRRRLSFGFACVLLALLLLQTAGWVFDLTLIPALISYAAEAILTLILGRMFLSSVSPDDPSENDQLRIKTIRTAMFYIMAATLAIIPLDTFSAVYGHILRATTALCGIYVVWSLYQLHRDKE